MSCCLAIFHKQLGDLVILEPTLRRLVQANGQQLDLITRSGFKPLSRLMPGVNFRSKPKAKVYDKLWCFDDRHKSAFYSFLSRAREKHLLVNPCALPQWYHFRIFKTISAPDPGRCHVSQYYWENSLDSEGGIYGPPQLEPPPREWAFPISSRNYLHVNPTSGWKSKNWTQEKWVITLNRLAEHGLGPIVMTSGQQKWQKEYCAVICRQVNVPIECVSGKTDMKNYLWLLWNAKAVLTLDGSASHIAAAFKRKCVTLFGHTDAACWHLNTAYSRAIVAGDILGLQFPRLTNLPHEPVIEATVKLWYDKG